MRKNKKVAGIAGLAAVMMIGGTLAYFNQTMTVENPFDTGKYDSVLTESFKPEDGKNWEPGAEVNKDIEVTNTGNYDVLVRVRFDEKWVKKGTNETVKENTGMDDTTSQADASDGLVAADGSVVVKKLNKDNWVYNKNDEYWYYKTNLAAGKGTGTFLDAVQLLENADMGNYIVKNYYTTAAEKPEADAIGEDPATQWVAYTGKVPSDAVHNMVVTKQDTAHPGYGNADYTLTITAQTVQATEAAVKDAFGKTEVAGCNWNLTQNKVTSAN